MRRAKSVALQYDDRLPAPLVVAQGTGRLAARLTELAREHGVPVVESAELAESLAEVDVGSLIPEVFYRAVAEVLAFIWTTGVRSHRGGDDGRAPQ